MSFGIMHKIKAMFGKTDDYTDGQLKAVRYRQASQRMWLERNRKRMNNDGTGTAKRLTN